MVNVPSAQNVTEQTGIKTKHDTHIFVQININLIIEKAQQFDIIKCMLSDKKKRIAA